MADALELPDDLVQLQRALDTAFAAEHGYITQVEAERRAQYPDEEQLLERRRWSDEQTAELARLRAETHAALMAVHRHPTLQEALASGAYQATHWALRNAARETASV